MPSGFAWGFFYPHRPEPGPGGTMKRIAVFGAILEEPQASQRVFNEVLSQYRRIVKGRMGIPFDEENTAVIALTLLGELDDINALTGKLGSLPHVTVKTAISGNLKNGTGGS
jgi:putative iron-only hydrogenase system regulator